MNHRFAIVRSLVMLGVVLAGAAAWWWVAPRSVINAALAVARVRDGFSLRTIATPDGRVPYLEGGHGPVVVLLHGFQDSKSSWLDVAHILSSRYRVLMPDLHGFGDNHAPTNGDYRPAAQAARVRRWLDALHVGKVNIAGVSMGGEVAAGFAAAYPQATITVALVSTAGASSDTLAPVAMRLLAGQNVFHVERMEQLDTLIRLIVDSGMTIPWIAKRGIVAEYRVRNAVWDSVFAQLIEPRTRMFVDSVASRIGAPALVLWGRSDPIFHRSTAPALAARLPHSELTVFADCGHLCPASEPKEVAARYLDFLREYNRP